MFQHIYAIFWLSVVYMYCYVFVACEVLTAVVIKSTILWDIMFCSPLNVNRRFLGTCRLHLQGLRIRQARNKREAGSERSYLCHIGLEATIPSKRRLTFNGVHGVIAQEMKLY
jgi:hypothetical protein